MSGAPTDARPDATRGSSPRWPAEWEPHAATWLAWPHNAETWPGRLGQAQREFVLFARLLADFEPVHVLASAAARQEAELSLADHPHIRLCDLPTNDAWVRDYGPIFLSDGRCVNYRFNSWGGKYPPWDLDNTAGEAIAAVAASTTHSRNLVLEGGAIEGNGSGDLLTTSRCVLSPSRNDGLTRERFEEAMRHDLRVQRVHWLENGDIPGDDTDGHIDQLARFVSPRTIVAAWCEDADDPAFGPLAAMHAELANLRTADNAPFEIFRVPLPKPWSVDGRRIPASYCNFVFAGSGNQAAVIVPQFGDHQVDKAADQCAVRIFERLFPHRRIIGSPSRELAWGLGSFHCLSMQQPLS